MFSFLVRDEHNMWIPTAHLVVERENGEIIAEGLRQIKQWCSGMSDFQFPSAGMTQFHRIKLIYT